LAAGGDGTFNDLLQATMLPAERLPIGIVPFGSGNVLAQELGVAGDAGQMAEHLVRATPTRIPVGLLCSRAGNETVRRYFTVAAGIGADARVICGVNPEWKRQYGIKAYYAEASRQLLFSRDPLPLFRVRFTDCQTGEERDETVSQVIVERVGYFSSPLVRRNGASGLISELFRLVLFKTQRRATYLRYGLQLLARRLDAPPSAIDHVEVAHATSLTCEALPGVAGQDVLTEVDGEMVGGLPAELTLIPRAIRLLVPQSSANQHAQ
jgi:diacylglycerol kinase family enzyme